MNKLIAVLIRHGDYHQLPNTPSAHQPFPLNDAGRLQATKAIELLKQMSEKNNWVFHPVIHSSNLLRSWQTADIIAKGIDAIDKLERYDELAERSLGSAANLTVGQIEQIIVDDPRFDTPPEDWKSNSDYCLPLQGAESLINAGKRVAQHLEKAMDVIQSEPEFKEEQAIAKIIVGHGAAFRHAAFHLQVLKFEQLVRLSMFHAQPVALERHQDGSWAHVDGEWKIRNYMDSKLD